MPAKKSILLRSAQHNIPVRKQTPANRTAILAITALAALPALAISQTLTNNAFNIRYGAGGITSLKRVNDKYDTEYLSPGGLLGNVVIQYRTATNSAWTTAREVGAATASPDGNTIHYSIGTLLPTLPQ